MRWFIGVALVGLFACGSVSGEPESSTLASTGVDLAPGRYQLVAPLIDCGLEVCPRGCPEVSMSTVDVAADGSALVDSCPRGWSCAHGSTWPLGDTYSPTLPKSGGVACSYDVTAGSFGPWLDPQAGEQ